MIEGKAVGLAVGLRLGTWWICIPSVCTKLFKCMYVCTRINIIRVYLCIRPTCFVSDLRWSGRGVRCRATAGTKGGTWLRCWFLCRRLNETLVQITNILKFSLQFCCLRSEDGRNGYGFRDLGWQRRKNCILQKYKNEEKAKESNNWRSCHHVH